MEGVFHPGTEGRSALSGLRLGAALHFRQTCACEHELTSQQRRDRELVLTEHLSQRLLKAHSIKVTVTKYLLSPVPPAALCS